LRFNTDIGRLEVWRGDHWATILGESPSLNGGARGLIGGGYTPADVHIETIDYVTISTLGNALDFGDLLGAGGRHLASCSSSTRGIWGGDDIVTNTIQYVTISSTGNAIDFGDLLEPTSFFSACSSSTRGVFGGGYSPASPAGQRKTLQYIPISTTGNSVNFGSLTNINGNRVASCSSSTRGIFAGGNVPATNSIEYITISTLGNAIDFGDLTSAGAPYNGCSNSTRGLFADGFSGNIDFITIATLGNAQDFGDLSISLRYGIKSCSSSTRGLFMGGYFPVGDPTIDYVTILTTGNALDFGDLTVGRGLGAALSNAHGGL
jgi:hypothetical protein